MNRQESLQGFHLNDELTLHNDVHPIPTFQPCPLVMDWLRNLSLAVDSTLKEFKA